MNSNNPRIQRFKEMIVLEERRTSLEQQIEEIGRRMSTLKDEILGGIGISSARRISAAPSRPSSGKSQRAPRGGLKAQIMAALEAAGQAGIRVTELAASLATKPVNIHSWFHSTGRRNAAIRKLSPGHYRLETSPRQSKAQSQSERKTPAKAGRKGAKSTAPQSKRGELSRRILEQLQAAGDKGITVREIADHVGAKRKNTYIWFATTGKRNPSIKKVGTARYKLLKSK